jgi:hypothetical protein
MSQNGIISLTVLLIGGSNNTENAIMRPRYLLLTLPLLLAGCLDDDNDRRGYRGHSDGYWPGPVYSDRDWDRWDWDRDRRSRSGPVYSDRRRGPSASDLQRGCQQGNHNACIGLNREIERRGGQANSASDLQRGCQQGNRNDCVGLNREIERRGGQANGGRPPWENRNGGSLR